MIIQGSLIFTTVMAGVFAWMIYESSVLPARAGMAPLFLGAIGLALCILELGRTIARGGAVPTRKGFTPKTIMEALCRGDVKVMTSSVILFVLVLVLGFLVAVPLFVFGFTRLVGHEGWKLGVALAVGSLGGFYLLFSILLPGHIYAGLLGLRF